jgi:hypothetical protein
MVCTARRLSSSLSMLRVWLASVQQSIGHWGVFSNPECLTPEQLVNPNGWFWARVFLWEARSFVQLIRFARKRVSAPRHTVLPFLCQTCAAAGNRFCYSNVGRYMLHIEELESLCPWIGWADRALLADTWAVALDKACCTLGSAKTLRHADCAPLDSTAQNALTMMGGP